MKDGSIMAPLEMSNLLSLGQDVEPSFQIFLG
jgi:hypothetical protein